MHGRLGSLLFLASQLFVPSEAAECKPLAVSLPFKSTTLSNRALAWGLPVQIGRPSAQTVALLPSASYNDTYMYGADGHCATNKTLGECTTIRGGLYDSAQSESVRIGTTMKHIWDEANATWTIDDVNLKDAADKDVKLSLLQFGVRVSTSHPYVNKGELGLGMNSTFLSALAAGQRIASKTYSFFWGTDAALWDDPRNGSLTLGGYDQALIGDATNTTTPFTRDQWQCREGMIVDLTGLYLNDVDGKRRDIMQASEMMKACVVPTLTSVLTLPEQYWDKMAELMSVQMSDLNNGTSRELFYGVASAVDAPFTGNLSIAINDAITVTIPNEQLIFSEPYIASNGLIKRNSSYKNIPVVRYTDANNNMPRLGGMFFSSAYLMVNHDKNEFTISQIQDNPPAQKLIGIDTANGCVAAVDGVVDRGAPNVPETPSSSSGLSGGVIAGIVVGVVAAIGIIAGIAFLVWRRKRRGAAAPMSTELETSRDGGPIVEKYGYSTSEMCAGTPPGEVSGHERDYAVELDGSSRPSEVPAHGVEREGLLGDPR